MDVRQAVPALHVKQCHALHILIDIIFRTAQQICIGQLEFQFGFWILKFKQK